MSKRQISSRFDDSFHPTSPSPQRPGGILAEASQFKNQHFARLSFPPGHTSLKRARHCDSISMAASQNDNWGSFEDRSKSPHANVD
ncbi:unnamed protein product [Protopolystoma xenopodis]|uniref:Uncharacterized protein n=1 Tax=Protopolystoma xenopodis TaxID=117903 RepID=A0A3S5C6V4_9PLAT|nr:unnamed protein product [Protopolystoma xenopodis]